MKDFILCDKVHFYELYIFMPIMKMGNNKNKCRRNIFSLNFVGCYEGDA